MSNTYSTGCGPLKLGTPFKLAPALGMIAKKVIADKVSEKVSEKLEGTPLKKKKGKGLKSACWKGYEAIGMKTKKVEKYQTVYLRKRKSNGFYSKK